MPTIRTSRNLTVFGIATILGVIAVAVKAVFDGDPLTNIDFEASIAGIGVGITAIMSKGQQTTGGTVDPSGKPV